MYDDRNVDMKFLGYVESKMAMALLYKFTSSVAWRLFNMCCCHARRLDRLVPTSARSTCVHDNMFSPLGKFTDMTTCALFTDIEGDIAITHRDHDQVKNPTLYSLHPS